MNSKDIEKKVEVTLGFVLGIISVVLGSLFIADGCNLALPIPSSGPACQVEPSRLVGLVLVTLGALVIVASIAVLRRRKH